MTKTPNYSLPQWEATDQVRMKDFNDAFSTIDGALFWERIKKAELETAQREFSLDVSDVDFSKYAEVQLYIDVPNSESSIAIRVNGIRSKEYWYAYTITNNESEKHDLIGWYNPAWTFLMRFYPPSSSAQIGFCTLVSAVTGNIFNSRWATGIAPIKWSELKSLDFEVSEPYKIQAGATFLLMGLRR